MVDIPGAFERSRRLAALLARASASWLP